MPPSAPAISTVVRSGSMSSPTTHDLEAAEELELPTSPVVGEFEDVSKEQDGGPSVPSPRISKSSTESQQPGLAVATPKPIPSAGRVAAAAARFETPNSLETGRPPRRAPSPVAPSPSSSFRSIPVGPGGRQTSQTGLSTSPERSSPSSSFRSFSAMRSPTIGSPEKEHSTASPTSRPSPAVPSALDVPSPSQQIDDPMATPTPASAGFAEVPLNQPSPLLAKSPAKEKAEANGRSFFSIPAPSLGFGWNKARSETSSTATSPVPMEAPLGVETTNLPSVPARPESSSSSDPSKASGWLSSLLSRSASGTSPVPAQSATMTESAGPSRSTSTSLLLHHMQSTVASRDRRTSKDGGGDAKLREGFERVREEMENAAREMRRERQRTEGIEIADTQPASRRSSMSQPVDWQFWGAVVQDYEGVAREKPKELSKAIQQGIPAVIRGAIWQLMSSSKSTEMEESYKALLKLPSPHEKSIVKDLNRTFPHHQFFKDGGGAGQESLFMVVKAYSLYDQEVGYTQGVAFIVAVLLLNMPDEEAFCVLVRLMDSYNLRSHFLADMPGLQLRLFQFDRLVEEVLPLLHQHFTRKGIKSSMFASQWFMTLFSYRFPLSLVYRVLDIVFAEGVEAIFRFSLALLRRSEDKLLELEFEDILAFLQSDLFEIYRTDPEDDGKNDKANGQDEEEEWRANEFVRDAYGVQITPFMLDSYESEYQEQCRNDNRHALELDQLRNANRSLSGQVKSLEASLSVINEEHVDLVRQLVMLKIEKEETESELIRYKMMYAELAHTQQDSMSNSGRMSQSSSRGHT